MTGVREAELKDLQAIVRCGRSFYSHVGFSELGLEFNTEWFMDYAIALIENPNAVFLVAVKDDKVVGGTAGELQPWTFNPNQRVVAEKWWWIDEDARGTRLAFRLIEGLEKWASAKGAVRMFLSSMESDNASSLDRIYKRMGFKLLEHNYTKGLQGKCLAE